MQRPFRFIASAFAVFFLLPAFVVAEPAVPAGGDLRESYDLLTTTAYAKIDPQKLLDGARAELIDVARKQRVQLTLPPIHAADGAANVAALADEIAKAQNVTHAPATLLTYAVIDGMAHATGDRYTAFFTPAELRQFNAALDPEKISGVGVLIQPDEATKFIRAYYVVPGTPADQAGIQSGDLFTSVDGVSTQGFTPEQASRALRGAAGMQVHISVQRDAKPFTVSIVRSPVQPPTVIYKVLPQNIGYIYVLAFGRDTPQQFTVALERLERTGARAYVLDLRNNGGGYVNSALDISSKFVNSDPLLTIQGRGKQATTIDATTAAIAAKPMTILVNRYTASASEITAGALQDDGVAVLVGEKTFGKGVMQTLTPLPDGAAIKITTAHYLTPKNRDINLKGIEPDYAVTENKDARFGEIDHDAQLQAALAILTKKLAVSGR